MAKSVGVVICNLGMLSPNRGTAISVQTVGGLTLEKLNILKEVGDEDIVAAAIELSGTVVLASIRNNIIVSPAGIRSVKTAGERGADVPRWLMAMAIEISNNFFQCSQSGIALGEGVAHTNGMRIQNNEFLSCKNVAISLSGYALARIGDLGAPVPTAQVLITGNTVSVGGSGIECAVDGVNISDNKLARHGSTGARADLNGIKLMRGLDPSGMDQCQVLANQIDGFSGTGILIQAKIRDLLVKLNVIQECGNGILADSGEQLDAVSIENNHVRDVATTRTSVGIGVFGAASAAIVGNTIKGVGLESASAVGILVRGVAHSRIAGNDVIDVGPKGEVGNGSGISVGAPFDDVQLANNYVTPSATRAGAWLALSVSESSRIERTDEVMVVRGETNSVVIARGRARFVRGSQDSEGGRKGANVSVLGNAFRSPGSQPMAELSAGGHIIFANNHCEPVGGISAARGVLIAADTVVVSSNHVLGGKSSILLEVAQKRMTVLGNITLTPILLESGDLPESWKPLNVVL